MDLVQLFQTGVRVIKMTFSIPQYGVKCIC